MTLGVQRPPRAIGAPLDRLDGAQKVTGTARYAYEYPVAGVTYVFPVQSTIAKGRVVSFDAHAASATAMSEGCVAMHACEAPRMASSRWYPSRAEQPLPGSRLLHGFVTSWK